MHIIGQSLGNNNELPKCVLPRQAVNAAYHLAGDQSGSASEQVMNLVSRTCRPPGAITRQRTDISNTSRKLLWICRESKHRLEIWAARGFVHIENTSTGEYKKWTLRDALALQDAMGMQIEATKWPDEKQMTRNAYLTLLDVCKEAKRQGDPTEMTEEESRSVRESIACAVLPGYGDHIKPKKVTFVGPKVAATESLSLTPAS
jgi:hypothetical protein